MDPARSSSCAACEALLHTLLFFLKEGGHLMQGHRRAYGKPQSEDKQVHYCSLCDKVFPSRMDLVVV